uniref:Uncharacterized protein n=1 Tax=Amphimedon queenslandica TaxID=400682 RepID=A0A1X7UV77_AMPQE
MADSSLDKSLDKPPPAPKLGRGLSKQYSIYPRKPSLKTLLGTLTAAIDVVKFLYSNDFTRSVGRDIIFFGGSVVIIKMVVSAMQEE